MMPDLQNAICDIEARAAAGARGGETTHSSGGPASTAPKAFPPPVDADAAEPATGATRSAEQAAKSWSAAEVEPRDPLQAAAHKVLMQMDATPDATLLLLAESPPPRGRVENRWGHVFAGLIDVPVLAIELASATPADSKAAATAGRTIPQITQSEHPGLCTLVTAWHTLKGKRADRWWSAAREHFGMILLDGSRLDPGAIESMLPRCSHVVFLVEYGNTSRSWASQIGTLIATRNTRSVGCIATAAPQAA